jgi:DNA-binding NarL/FixJ family response regulator
VDLESIERQLDSEGTVQVHVKHILGKLGFSARAQVAGVGSTSGPWLRLLDLAR